MQWLGIWSLESAPLLTVGDLGKLVASQGFCFHFFSLGTLRDSGEVMVPYKLSTAFLPLPKCSLRSCDHRGKKFPWRIKQ